MAKNIVVEFDQQDHDTDGRGWLVIDKVDGPTIGVADVIRYRCHTQEAADLVADDLRKVPAAPVGVRVKQEIAHVSGRVTVRTFEAQPDSIIGQLFSGQGAAVRVEIVERNGDTTTYTTA